MEHATMMDRRILRRTLMTQSGFVTARALSATTGLTKRQIRQVNQTYPTLMVTGQHGYKLTSMATDKEIAESVHHLLSRSEKLMSRAHSLSTYALSRK